ncbi:MAG: M20/M25/M40 family metallo-hydrolase [Acidobacteriia bacterium]|nr:M20/M25/M40 family metallo-hydrolase [Terriglobia bacterium]
MALRPRRPRIVRLVIPLILLLLSAAWAGEQASPKRYIEDVKVLTEAKMEGRGDGTKGLSRAAKYIEKEFKRLGLEPAGVDGSYRQPFTVTTGAKLKGKNHLVVKENGKEWPLKLEQDYIPLSFSSVGTVSGPLVFAGYGASADEFGYDDYMHFDVKDRIVVVLRYEPTLFGQKSGGQGKTQHSHLITKAINAKMHGAKAVLLVNGKLDPKEEDALVRFGSLAGPEDAGIPIVQVKNAAADEWFKAAGKSLSEVQGAIDKDGKPQSFAFPPGVQATLAVDIERTHATVNNILAYLPGKTDEYVILGAHYDHLGYGNASSLAPSQVGKLHPGADDNASGTAGVLELARLLAPQKGKLERGVMFMSFAGEEIGLLGSADWVKEPTRPLEKAVAMINLDMIGRPKNLKIYVGGVGTGSTFRPLVEKAAKDQGLTAEISQGGYAASDHTSFLPKRIPVLFVFSGLHSDYHKPSDTWEKIDSEAAAKVVDMVEEIATGVDNAAERPQFVKVEMESAPMGGGAGGYGPWFGSVPDFGETANGVKFADVTPGSPAAKAGFKAGDILVQFGEMPIKNLYDFTFALRKHKIGDEVEVTVLREGQPVKAKVTLAQRK